MPRKESPVEVGDKVYVVETSTMKVLEAEVASNPGENLWVTIGKKKQTPVFVGPMRWDKTSAGAKKKAKVLITERLEKLSEEIATLQEQLKTL